MSLDAHMGKEYLNFKWLSLSKAMVVLLYITASHSCIKSGMVPMEG